MALGIESDYRLLPLFIALTRSVLNPRNNDFKSLGYAIFICCLSTDYKSRKVYSASNSRFCLHELNKMKYAV